MKCSLLSLFIWVALTVVCVRATGQYEGQRGSSSGPSSSTHEGAHVSRVLQALTEPLFCKYGAGSSSESVAFSHGVRMQKVQKSVYTPSRNAGRAKSGRELVRERGLILPVKNGEEVRFATLAVSEEMRKASEEEKQTDSPSSGRTNLKNLRSKYVSLYNAAKRALPQDAPTGAVNKHFYHLVEQHHAHMARQRRARYISKKVGTYLTAQEADEVRTGFLDIRHRIENVYEPQRPRLRREQSVSSNKSRLKRKLKVDPDDKNVIRSIDRFGYSVNELMARKTGRKRRHFGLIDVRKGKDIETPNEPLRFGGDADVVDGQLQRQKTVHQMLRFHLDLNEPAPMEGEG